MPAIDVVDETFLAVPRERVARRFADPSAWPRLWPDLGLELMTDRGAQGVRWTVVGERVGTMEVWLEEVLDGTVLHYFLRVDPAVLEDRLRAHPLVGQCLVVGDQKPFIAALVTIDPEALPGWRERNGKQAGEGADAGDLVDDPELRGEIAAAVEEANQAVSRAEQIRKFRILPHDFSEASGEMTPTLKVKRNVVVQNYAADIEAVYETASQRS